MNAPTLWEEGRLSASRVVRLAVLAGVVALALDLAVNDHLTPVFDVLFVLICVAAVIGVRPTEFTSVALLPPLLLLGVVGVLGLVDTGFVAEQADSWFQALVSGVTHRATGLAVGYGLVLAVIVIRIRVQVRRAQEARGQAQRSGSPAPIRTTSG